MMISHQQWRAAFNCWLRSPNGWLVRPSAEVQVILDLRESGAISADEALRRLGVQVEAKKTGALV